MTQFQIINDKLQEINSELIKYANLLEFEEICEFNMENCSTNIPWHDLNASGYILLKLKMTEVFLTL